MLTEDEIKRAEAEIGKWFWQPAEGHNYRYVHAVRTMVRYHECVTPAADTLRILIEYLRTQEFKAADGAKPKLSLLNKTVELEEGWTAQDAWYQTASGDEFEGTKSDKVRIYQVIQLAPEEGKGDGPYAVENGCKYKVTHQFFWNTAQIPSVPSGTSGVRYSLQGATRDSTTGLWSCVIERRETVQQDIPQYKRSETAFEHEYREAHHGVKASASDSTGPKAGVSAGTRIVREETKNEDCTKDISAQKIVEKPVRGARKIFRKTIRGTAISVTDRSQAQELTPAGMKVGETRTTQVTEGELHDNTEETFDASPAGKILDACSKTAFEHVHTETVNQKHAANPAEAPAPAGGVTVRVEDRIHEESATHDVQTTVTTELPVRGARKTVRRDLRTVTESVLDRSQPLEPEMGSVAPGEVLTTEETPGRLHNNTSEKTNPVGVVTVAESVDATPVVRTVSKIESVPADQAQQPKVETAVNEQHEVSYRKRDDGVTADKTDVHRVWEKKTGTGKSESEAVITTTKHTINSPDVPAAGSPGVNRQVEVDARPNEHGSFDVTERVTVAKPVTAISRSNWATEKTVTTVTRNNPNKEAAAGMGTASSEPTELNSATTRISETTPVPFDSGWIEWTSVVKSPSKKYNYRHGVRVFVNLDTVPTPKSGVQCEIRPSINKFGKYDGNMSYSELVDWEDYDGGSGSGGGVKSGTIEVVEHRTDKTGRRWKRTVKLGVVGYTGTGNSAAELTDRLKAKYYPGVRLDARTYITSIDDSAAWQADK